MLDLKALENKKEYEYFGVHKEAGEYTFRAYNEKAFRAELTGDLNSWGSTHMKKIGNGVFEARVKADPSIEGTCYKYRFYTEEDCFVEPDRYAVYSQCGKEDSSIIYFGSYEWGDGEWIGRRNGSNKSELPINVYEMHLGSWRTREGRSYTDRDAYLNYRDIAPQLIGYVSDMGYTHVCLLNAVEERSSFAPTSKHGRPDEFKLFVDMLHRSDIGVILECDETVPIEYWTNEFHIDGFLISEKKLVLTDESFLIDTAWRDTVIDYAEADPKHKKYKYAALNRALTEGFEKERLLSVLHSDVSKGKRSLLEKMQGDSEEKFARLRLFFSFMMLHPGKKLMFMGCELGEESEWNESTTLDWFLLECEANSKLKKYIKDLGHLYLNTRAMWEKDFSWRHFEWIPPLTPENDVMCFARSSLDGEKIFAVFNFGDEKEKEIIVDERIDVILNSDDDKYGGKGRGKICDGKILISPLSAIILRKKTPFF